MSGKAKPSFKINTDLLGILLGVEGFWAPIEPRPTYPRYLEIRGAVNSIANGVLALAQVAGDREAIAFAKAMVECSKAQVSAV